VLSGETTNTHFIIFDLTLPGIEPMIYQTRDKHSSHYIINGAYLHALSEGGAKIFGVFRVKNHDFTPKNPIFFNCGGRRENFWGISCEKS
jgi:hypothetical protein